MAAFFQSLEKTLVAGVVLVIVMIVLAGLISGHWIRPDYAYWQFFMRWLHVISGVMWIGLLWYLNFVQTPTMPKIEPAEHRAAISKFIAPNVLFWFRYGALATVVTGLLLAWQNDYIVQALMFRPTYYTIGIGMWLALIMAFNVWFIIWPNQKKALGMVTATDDDKKKAARMAFLASRANLMLSLPMLFAMLGMRHLADLL